MVGVLMNHVTLSAFRNELEKIAISQKHKDWAAAQHGVSTEFHKDSIHGSNRSRRVRRGDRRASDAAGSKAVHEKWRADPKSFEAENTKFNVNDNSRKLVSQQRRAGTLPKAKDPGRIFTSGPASLAKKPLSMGAKAGIGLAAAGALGAGTYGVHHLIKKHKEQGSKKKQAGIMQNVSAPVRWAGRHTGEALSNLAETVGTLAAPREAVRAGWRETVEGLKTPGMGGKFNAGMLALGTAASIPGMAAKNDPSGQGDSRIARGAAFVGSQVGGLMGAPFGLTGGLAGGIAGDIAGRKVGRAIDRVRGYKPAPHAGPVTPTPIVPLARVVHT